MNIKKWYHIWMRRDDPKNPILSVIIPSFNEEKYIAECLRHVKKQSISPDMYEILLVDNDSTDNTVNIAKKYNVSVLHYTANHQLGSVREHGVKHALGAIIAFIDADIRIPETWLSDVVHIFNTTKLVCIGGKVLPERKTLLNNFIFFKYDAGYRISQFFGKVLLWGSNMAIYKNVYEAVGGFDKKLHMAEDWDLSIRLQKIYGRDTVSYIPSLVCHTSARKQERLDVLLRYSLQGTYNYTNIVLLGRKKTTKIMNIR